LQASPASSRRRPLTTGRVTMSYMKTSTITIRLDDALSRELDQACAQTGRTRSELAREALRRQLALLRFERLRKRTLPLAEAQGYLTDEDVLRDVS
jgi:predicted transcriptional regulator